MVVVQEAGAPPVQYYAGVGLAWVLIAVVFDFLFIVLLFQATTYYQPDVFLYYVLTFLIPVGVGLYLNRTGKSRQGKGNYEQMVLSSGTRLAEHVGAKRLQDLKLSES